MVSKVYLAAHQLRIETIFKACSNYLGEQLNEHNCLSMFITCENIFSLTYSSVQSSPVI